MNVILVTNETQLKDAYSVRMRVFVEEQQVPPEEEIDQYENDATHFVVYDGSKPIGAGRLRELDNFGKVERICIDKDYRTKGIGKLLMDAIEKEAKERGLTAFKLNAQIQATEFYSKLGYEVCSDVFLDAGIPHVTMKKLG
ncbi:GNAT family N-acetyltransferase [Anaerobacillus isosaccharinicus]|uniref:GNAT family N-acetyltransferase n=1 Tax=Anaerobacillus isosaccharinicus TaxID=1532552 RepID=A0A1S2MB74_9BACI|nr:GNAT family N-acetyltransferase [Anaerobacillus isosaccharinicus]MBA5587601.1 GNAT family N-acetyltransferase [Anaerobacillus isosaccharinicus]QOY34222.1 GNAT family N-acetyltransferase [Anaerobacillus isosaccharinicus]